jgi:hypothetical protein
MMRCVAAACLLVSAESFLAPRASTRAWRAAGSPVASPATPFRRASAAVSMSTEEAAPAVPKRKPTKQDERKRIASGDNFYRGHGWAKNVKKKVEAEMKEQYDSDLVKDLKARARAPPRGEEAAVPPQKRAR